MSKNTLADLLNGNLSPEEKLLNERHRAYLLDLEKQFNLTVEKWGKSEWRAVGWVLIRKHVELGFQLDVTTSANIVLFADQKRRKKQDKERVENRQDQIDKRAFQDMVKNNIGKYATKADAIHALKTISQFTDYPETTLRRWLTPEVWTKPTQKGRPAKTKK